MIRSCVLTVYILSILLKGICTEYETSSNGQVGTKERIFNFQRRISLTDIEKDDKMFRVIYQLGNRLPGKKE